MATLAASSYGKDLVRVLRVVRSPSDPSSHQIAEYTVCCLLSSDTLPSGVQPSLDRSYTHADNSAVVATDTVKNTINYLAKTLPAEDVLCPERFALNIASHFPSTYSHIGRAEVEVLNPKWTRIVLASKDGGPHKHSFVRDGEELRTARATATKTSEKGEVRLTRLEGGIKNLLVLKSSGSAFHGFHKDQYTTLIPVNDRIFSTSVECTYNITLPSRPLPELLKQPSSLPPFCDLSALIKSHTLRIFALDASASVQATMFRMADDILADASSSGKGWEVADVSYTLPNKHYIPIDLNWAKKPNLKEKDAEVFLPTAHPSGLIKAKMTRTKSKL